MSLDERTQELIAIGASVTANCMECVAFHAAKARGHGADEGEIREAIRVGRLVRRGAASKFDNYAQRLQEEGAPASPKCDGGCA